MKKIFSLILASLMLLSLSLTTFASTSTISMSSKEINVGTGTTDVTLNMTFELDAACDNMGIMTTLNFNAEAVTLKSVDDTGFKALLNAGDTVDDLCDGVSSISFMPASGVMNFKSVTIPVTFTVKDTEAAEYVIAFEDDACVIDADGNPIELASEPVAGVITVKADDPIVPDVETVEMAAPAFMTETATSSEAKGWQVGQGVALKFTVADLAEFVAMNWKLTCDNIGTKYAKVADEAFAAIKASDAETIDVFASFIVNTKDAKETVNTITAVGAGFKKADGTVVETK